MQAAIKDIYQKHADDVYAFAYYLTGDRDEAMDIVSETFINLWTSSREIRQQTIRVYLLKIAKNLFLKRLHLNQRKAPLDREVIDAQAAEPDRHFEGQSQIKRVSAALSGLPEQEHMALIMKAYHHLSYVEIAHILNTSVAAAKVKVHRARVKLGPVNTKLKTTVQPAKVTIKARIAWFGHSNRVVSNAGCGLFRLNPWGWVVFSTPQRFSVAHVE